MRRYIFAVLFGLGGAGVLVGLSWWQVQRLEWKTALIAEIKAKIGGQAVVVPQDANAPAHRYLPVVAEGVIGAGAIFVLTSQPRRGPGYRVIVPFQTDGRRLLLDRGFVLQRDKDAGWYEGAVTVRGNLDWPRETDSYTPPPDRDQNIWFARDVASMAAQLGTEPVLIVAAAPTGSPSPMPMPVTAALRNTHLEYAVTWGLLAVVWLAMTGYLVLRIRRNTA